MKKQLLIAFFAAGICSFLTAQNLHRVNNNTDFDADFTTLQAAVTAAAANDTIYLEGSAIHYEGATIDKPLTIVGPGFFLGENPETQAIKTSATINSDVLFTSGSEGSAMMGCELLWGTDLNISVSDITLIRNRLDQVEFTGTSDNIVIIQNYITASINAGTGTMTNTIISNNIINVANYSQGAIYSQNTSGPLVISNNVCCTRNASFPIDCHNAIIQNNIVCGENSSIRENTGNTISHNVFATDGTDANGNRYNIDMNLVFADFDGSLELSTDGKWELKAGSPALGAGSGGVDGGAFGGATPYVLSGVPNLPHIYEADVPASATSESGLPVSITVRSGE